ncbi:MAG: hypothetical protein ACREGH_00365 [Minisyncoccia bacterium]
MAFQHSSAAGGKWGELSLMEQLGNIGSEVGRAAKWQGRDEKIFNGAAERALELFDLTLEDERWRGARRREIGIAREVFCDALFGGPLYQSTLPDLERYFFPYALLARA